MAKIGDAVGDLTVAVARRGLGGAAALLLAAAAAIAASPAPATAGTGVWTPLGPDGGDVEVVAVDPADPQILYAGSRGGVWKSLDGGASWLGSSRGLQIQAVQALAVDPQQPETVYAALGDGGSLDVGLAVSRNGGATWTQTLTAGNGYADDGGEEYFSCLAVDPAHPGTVFAGSNFAIRVSSDGGRSWPIVKSFASLSPDSGVTVQLAADVARGSVFAYVTNPSALGAGGPLLLLLESRDGGATWQDKSAALPAAPAGAGGGFLAIEPTPPSILFLARGGTLFRSVDDAATWHAVAAGSGPVSAGPHGLVVAGGGTGNGSGSPATIATTNGGRSWSPIAAPPIGVVRGYAFGAAAGSIYAAGSTLGVVASQDGGRSWQAANRGLAATAVVAVAVDPARPSRLYAATADAVLGGQPQPSGLLKTGNGGGTWRAIGDGQLAPLSATASGPQARLDLQPTEPGALLYGYDALLARSADFGATWTYLTDLPEGLLPATVVGVPAAPLQLHAAGRFGSACTAWSSADGGASWTCLGLADVVQIVPAPPALDTLYALTASPQAPLLPHVLWRTTNAGATWTPIDAGLPVPQGDFAALPAVAVDPTNSKRLFVAFTSGIFRSLDGGAHWTAATHGLPLARAANFPLAAAPLLAIDPNQPQLLYAAAKYLGVYRSLDSGAHWQPILAGLPPLDPSNGIDDAYEALVPDPQHPGTLYLATWGNGLLTYSAN